MHFKTSETSHGQIPEDPWDWYICLHEWWIFMVNVGEYARMVQFFPAAGHSKR